MCSAWSALNDRTLVVLSVKWHQVEVKLINRGTRFPRLMPPVQWSVELYGCTDEGDNEIREGNNVGNCCTVHTRHTMIMLVCSLDRMNFAIRQVAYLTSKNTHKQPDNGDKHTRYGYWWRCKINPPQVEVSYSVFISSKCSCNPFSITHTHDLGTNKSEIEHRFMCSGTSVKPEFTVSLLHGFLVSISRSHDSYPLQLMFSTGTSCVSSTSRRSLPSATIKVLKGTNLFDYR